MTRHLVVTTYGVILLLMIVASAVLMEPTIVGIMAIVSCVAAVTSAVASVIWRRNRDERMSTSLVAFALCVLGIMSVAVSHWPLHLAFFVSRASMRAAAAEISSGHPITDKRVGAFFVRRGEVSYHGVVALWVNMQPSGRTGFVQCPPNKIPFNLWSTIRLDEQWQLIAED